jgi:flagellar motor switch protein FliN/FliY
VLFTVSKTLIGDMAILSAEAGALALAQIFVSEPVNPAAPFDKGCRDAYEELLRQVVGQMATNLTNSAGGEVEIKHSGSNPPVWPNAGRACIRITSEKFPPIRLDFVVTTELAVSFRPPKAVSQPVTVAAVQPPPPQSLQQPAAPPARGSNLELLLDVKLDATIRFGQKQMLLRDVLELHPGVAIALDRKVEEPVDLLVGGRMVARGEVVIVDGNYGLRITEIVSPEQRIESLRTAL